MTTELTNCRPVISKECYGDKKQDEKRQGMWQSCEEMFVATQVFSLNVDLTE